MEVETLSPWEHLGQVLEFHHGAELPKVSVIIPTFNHALVIGQTLESVLHQNYPDFEVIVMDGGSKDRTLEVVDGVSDERVRVYSLAHYDRYQMWNQGVKQAKGEYINLLDPGTYYLWEHSLTLAMELAREHQWPDLAYGATVRRVLHEEPVTLFRQFDKKELQKGRQPTNLGSCWFRRESFLSLQGFRHAYRYRASFDLFCRFLQEEGLKAAGTSRVLVDDQQKRVSQRTVVGHFWDSLRLLFYHFGFWTMVRWLWTQKDLNRLIEVWFKSLRLAFLGR